MITSFYFLLYNYLLFIAREHALSDSQPTPEQEEFMNQSFHELLLSELRMVVYKPGNAELTDRMLCEAVTLNENLRSLGFALRPKDLVLLANSPELYGFYDHVHKLVPQVLAKPMYPGFPQQVLDMDEAAFRLHQAMHYFSTYGLELLYGVNVSRGWLPESSTPERTREARPTLDAKVIELVAEADAPKTVLRILLGRRERLTNPELELVMNASALCNPEDIGYLTVRFKENLELLFPRLLCLENGKTSIHILSAICAHSGDVLRCAHTFIKAQDYHLKTVQKKRLVRLLEQYSAANLKSNLMQSRQLRERNLLVLKYLDFNRFAKSAEHRDAVRALRNGELLSWNSIAEQMLSRHDPKTLHFLAGRPGTMLRMINRLLSLDYAPEDILAELRPQAGKFSGQMLMKAIRSLAGREGKLEELHQKEIRDCNQRYAQEARYDPAQQILQRYQWQMQCIHNDAATDRRAARVKYITKPEQEIKQAFRAVLQEAEAAISKKEAALAKVQEALEQLDQIEDAHAKGHDYRLIRNATVGFVPNLGLLLFRPDLFFRQQAILLKELEEQKAKLEQKQQEAHKQLEEALKDIAENGQTYYETAVQKINQEEQEKLASVQAAMEAELAPYRAQNGSLAERQARELAMLESLHQSRLRISKYDAAAIAVLKELCTEHFRQAETPLKGKKVFLKLDEFDLQHSELETTDRSKDGGYIRSGIAFRIPDEAKTVRFFVYWNDRERVDIDLHAAGKTEEGNNLHIGWNADYKNSGVVHSGDITHSDAAEYIDIDLSAPIRTITANVSLFSGKWDFKHIETCYVGMMAVSEMGQEVKLYSPANCFFTHRLTQDTRSLFYGYIDVQNRFVRFIGQPNSNGWAAQFDDNTAFSLADYLNRVIEGQGAELAESEETSDVVLTMGKSLTDNGISLVDENFFLEC